jgi:hypothetical protein
MISGLFTAGPRVATIFVLLGKVFALVGEIINGRKKQDRYRLWTNVTLIFNYAPHEYRGRKPQRTQSNSPE